MKKMGSFETISIQCESLELVGSQRKPICQVSRPFISVTSIFHQEPATMHVPHLSNLYTCLRSST